MKFKSDAQRKAVMSQYSSDRPMMNDSAIAQAKTQKPSVDKAQKEKAKLLEPFKKSRWEEKDVKLALRRINAGKITASEIFAINTDLDSGEGVELTTDQQLKGKGYLVDKAFTSTGKRRTNSPFREREESVINDPDAQIRLKDFYSERGNFYVPLYEVTSKEGSFDYAVIGGKPQILG